MAVTCENCIELQQTQLVVSVRDEQKYTIKSPGGTIFIRRYLDEVKGHYSVQYKSSEARWQVGLLCQVLCSMPGRACVLDRVGQGWRDGRR